MKLHIHTEHTVAINDRAFNYGDGFFTTMRVEHYQVECLALHITRLQSDAHRLGFIIDSTSWSELSASIERVARTGSEQAVVKVLISRGSGGRGYSMQCAQSPIAVITTSALPPIIPAANIRIAQGYISTQPLLAGIKHINRLEQVLFKRQADALSVDDVLCLDMHQHVIETSSANLFWYNDERWHTPALNNCGVKGVYRDMILNVFDANKLPYSVAEYDITALVSAQSVFMCNAVRGVVPIATLSLTTDQLITFTNSQIAPLLGHIDTYFAKGEQQ